MEAPYRLFDQRGEDVVGELQLHLGHKSLVRLAPLLFLLVRLSFEDLLVYYFLYDLLSLLVLKDLTDLVLLRAGFWVLLYLLRMMDGAGTGVGPREHIVLHLVEHSFQRFVDRLDIVLDLHERVLAALLRPRHRLALLTVRADQVHCFIHGIKNSFIVNVISFRDHVRELLLVDVFFTLLFDLFDGFLDHALSLFLERQIQLHVQDAEERGIQLLVLEHVVIEGALRAVQLILELSLAEDVELVQGLVVDWCQEGIQELGATLSNLLEYVFNVRLDCFQGSVDAGNQLLIGFLLASSGRVPVRRRLLICFLCFLLLSLQLL